MMPGATSRADPGGSEPAAAPPPSAPPAPSLRRWLATTGLPLVLLLLGCWLFDRYVLRVQPDRLDLGTFLTFLAVYPFCYVFGLTLAAGRSTAAALINGVAGLCALLAVGTVLSAAVLALGVVSLGVLAFPGIPAAGAAYGLALDQLQRLLLGYPAGWRQAWRRLHWICGLAASALPFAIIFLGVGQALPGPAISLLYGMSALPHLLRAWRQLRRDERAVPALPVSGRRLAIVRLGAIVAALPILGYCGNVKLIQFAQRPPLITAGRLVAVPIADRSYAIPGAWITHYDWRGYKDRFARVKLDRGLDPDMTAVVGTDDPNHRIMIEADDLDARTGIVPLPCRSKAFGRLSACWIASSLQSDGKDPLWTPPAAPDFSADVALTTGLRIGRGIFLLDDGRHVVGRLRPASPDLPDGTRRYRLIVMDGAVDWSVPVTAPQLPFLDRAVDAVRALQGELRASGE